MRKTDSWTNQWDEDWDFTQSKLEQLDEEKKTKKGAMEAMGIKSRSTFETIRLTAACRSQKPPVEFDKWRPVPKRKGKEVFFAHSGVKADDGGDFSNGLPQLCDALMDHLEIKGDGPISVFFGKESVTIRAGGEEDFPVLRHP